VGNGCNPAISFPAAGTFTIVASYTDAHGATGTASTGVNVQTSAKLIGTILNPHSGAVFTEEDTVTVQSQLVNASSRTTQTWTLTNLASNQTHSVTLNNGTFRIVDVFPEFNLNTPTINLRLTLNVTSTSGQKSDPASVDIVKVKFIK
jgi:hypothetical protein